MNRYRVHIENYKTIDEMEISLDPGVEGFVGDNAQGKTNILTAIQDLVNSKNDPARIKDGEKRSVLRLDITDEEGQLMASISRIQTHSDCRLESKGLPIGRTPATYLASLLDAQMVNPIRLISEDPVRYLKKHLPAELIDEDYPDGFDIGQVAIPGSITNGFVVSEMVANHVAAIRKDRGRTLHEKEIVIADLRQSIPEQVSDCQWVEAELRTEMQTARDSLSKIELQLENRKDVDKEIDTAKEDRETCLKSIEGIAGNRAKAKEVHKQKKESLLQEIKILEQKVEAYSAQLNKEEAAASAGVRQYETAIEKLEAKKKSIIIPDETELHAKLRDQESKLKEIESHKKLAAASDKVKAQEADLDKIREEHKNLDLVYKHFAYELPKKLISRGGVPVKGMEFRDGSLYVKDRRIDLLSETERAIVATQLAVALAKKKKHLCISLDGVEIMDPEHRKTWLDIAAGAGIKVLYTRQGKPEGPHEFLVIDGKVSNGSM